MVRHVLCAVPHSPERVGMVVGRGSLVAVHNHGTVTLLVAHAGIEGLVDGNLEVVGTQAVAVCVRVTAHHTPGGVMTRLGRGAMEHNTLT